jgi:hypothetical protein
MIRMHLAESSRSLSWTVASYFVMRELFAASLWMDSMLQTYVDGIVLHLDQSGHLAVPF